MAQLVVTRRPSDGNIELMTRANLGSGAATTLLQISALLANIQPTPIHHGCKRDGNTSMTQIGVVLNGHTSNKGVLEAIGSFQRIVSTVALIDAVDVSAL